MNSMKFHRLFLIFKITIFVSFIVVINSSTYAQWPALSTPNVQLTSSAATSGDLKDYWACSDGVGGSYSIFTDDRQDVAGGNESVYCQRVDRWGNIKFVANGVAISTIAGADQDRPKVTSDAFNNAIACWQDDRASPGSADDIYVQKIDSSGAVQWLADGILICNAVGKQDKVWIISDGSGGAIIAWEDARTDVAGGTEDIYAQRINSAGAVQWGGDGVVICNAVGRQKEIHMLGDGVGGATIVWRDDRSGAGTPKDIYAQKINAAGLVQWAVNGVVVCNEVNDQNKPKIATDGGSGAIITWTDKRTGTEDVYAQRINSSGVVHWVANGLAICTAVDVQKNPVIASDSYGGVVIAWEDSRTGGVEDIYAQRIDSSGTIHWPVNGNVVSNAADVQKKVDIAGANNGKVLLVWEDARTGGVEDIYLQVIDTAGVMLGTANGIAVSTAADVQKKPFVFRSGATDWITIWQDDRNKSVTGNTDLYVQGLNPTIVAVLPIELVIFEANINDDRVDIKWITATEINNDYFTVERSVDAKTWEEVIVTAGAGNSNQILEYFEADYEPIEGISYYRLKQTDFNGAYEYFNIVPVKYVVDNSGNGTISLYPSPASAGETVKIEFKNIFEAELLVVLRDIQGKEFYSKVVINIEDGKLIGVPIERHIPSGVYLITATSENQMYSQKLIIK